VKALKKDSLTPLKSTNLITENLEKFEKLNGGVFRRDPTSQQRRFYVK